MFSKQINCIICEKQLEKTSAIKKHGVYFCTEKCCEKYQEQLEELNNNMTLDDCC